MHAIGSEKDFMHPLWPAKCHAKLSTCMFENLIINSDLKSYTRPIFSFEYDCQCAWELCCLESTAKMIGWPPCIGFWTLQVLVYNFDCLLCKILCAYINVIFFPRSCIFAKIRRSKGFWKCLSSVLTEVPSYNKSLWKQQKVTTKRNSQAQLWHCLGTT